MNELQGLVQEVLIGCGHIECAAFLQKKDHSVRASSVGYEVSQDQVSSLISAFKNPSAFRQQGIKFNGATYKCVRADKDSIYGKKVTFRVLKL